ncbi:PiggyBac transposable element-derived protein 4-like [Elysia marginata]|uniref:PiggyBac transposable element-derived protein 4-like n=1 Tax=Elysia marginata TaxID=1093978 RepID=A0AAV4I2D8_9GAST|nr:PiggyBac transposable element-derived protein 4-like [Elysia marginata]
MEVIDLGDPATLRRLATADDSSSENQQASSSSSPEPPFIAELYQASNASDIESDDEEFLPIRRRHLKKGDKTVNILTDRTLNYIRFMDLKEVRVLMTAHGANSIQTGKTNPVTKEPIVKFEAVHQYNQFMGAVDRSDQMVSYDAFKRRTLKWWKKAFFHLFMLGVLNAFLVHKATAVKKLSHRIFAETWPPSL